MVGKGSPTVFSDAGRLNMVPDPMVQVVPGCLADLEDLPFRGTKKIHAALAPNTIAGDQHSRVGWVRPIADGGTGVTKGISIVTLSNIAGMAWARSSTRVNASLKSTFPHRSLSV